MIFLLGIITKRHVYGIVVQAIHHIRIKSRGPIEPRSYDATLFRFRRKPEHVKRKPSFPFSRQDCSFGGPRKPVSRYSQVSSTLPNIPVYTSPTRRDGCLLSKSAAGAIATCVTSHEADVFHRKDIAISKCTRRYAVNRIRRVRGHESGITLPTDALSFTKSKRTALFFAKLRK